jgi:ABC-type branched-subunit amino acid transport system substrate-binding protein
LAERNAVGGVGGYKVELVALNDFGEPDEAHLQAREFAADPAVLGVVTGWNCETAQAALPVYRQVGLPVAVPWSVSPELADRESGVVLVAADAQRIAEVLTEFIAATGPSRPALIGNGRSVAYYAELMGQSGLDPEVMSPPPSAADGDNSLEWVTPLIQDRGQTPDALILTTDGAQSGEVSLLLASSGWSGSIYGGVEAGSINLVSVAGSVADGLVFASPAPAGKDVAHIGEHPGPDKRGLGPRAVLAYDATHILLDAIDLAIREDGFPSREGVAVALPMVRRSGLTGSITFDVGGLRADAPVWLYGIQDNRYPGQVLLSTEIASGE